MSGSFHLIKVEFHILFHSLQEFRLRFRCPFKMASIPGCHDEVKNFVNKFLSLHGVGRKARLNLDCHNGQLWVSLHTKLGEQPGQAVPLLPQHGAAPAPRQTKPPPREASPAGKLAEPDVCLQHSLTFPSTSTRLPRLQ